MRVSEAIERLESEWEKPDGFFGRLREGSFDPASLARVGHVLESVEAGAGDSIDRRLVPLVWYAPTFMSWQRERVGEGGGDVGALEAATTRIQNLAEKRLGVP